MAISQQQMKKVRDRIPNMKALDLRDFEYALLADVESKSGKQFHPEDRAMITVTACCWLAGLYTIAVTPGPATTQLAGLFKSFWLAEGRSPTLGEARALVTMIDATLMERADKVVAEDGPTPGGGTRKN